MLHVSPIVEALRGRPRLVLWVASVSLALAWVLVPSIFYASPPGDLPLVLAVGHEWQLGSAYGPPLAFWLAEVAFRLTGSSVFGVYLLSQVCVVVTFWAMYTLGRSIVGASHAALAVLLMVGIAAFGAPTPDFGPAVLAMALTALAWLFFWRAVGEGHLQSFIALGVVLGLLFLTTYFAVLVLILMMLFMVVSERGRASLVTFYPYLVIPIMALIALPHLIWLWRYAVISIAAENARPSIVIWGRQLLNLLIDHAGLLVLVIVSSPLLIDRKIAVPELVRAPVDPFARSFVYGFALVPAVLATLIATVRGHAEPLGGEAALLVLSGLACIVLAGDVIRLYRQPLLGSTWMALLVGPPLLAILAVLLLPWTLGTELKVSEPSAAMGRFFTESFNRRTGKPLAIVVGGERLGGLVALASPQRPSLLVDGELERTPWLREADLREKGAIVVWPITDLAGAPPQHLRERFPDLVAEVPRAFERTVQGRLPLLRIGWAMIRPQSAQPPAAPPSEPSAAPQPAPSAPPAPSQ
jgi:hypothetical protein